MVQEWGRILDLVIWIDAPNEILLDRIRTRAKEHRMKNRPSAEVVDFLENYRAAYGAILSGLQSNGKTRVLRIDSGETKPAAIAEAILDYRRAGVAVAPEHSLVDTSNAILANE